MSSPPAAVAASPVDAGISGGIEGVAVRALDTSQAKEPPGESPCAPPAPCPKVRFLELRKRQWPRWPTSARPPDGSPDDVNGDVADTDGGGALGDCLVNL